MFLDAVKWIARLPFSFEVSCIYRLKSPSTMLMCRRFIEVHPVSRKTSPSPQYLFLRIAYWKIFLLQQSYVNRTEISHRVARSTENNETCSVFSWTDPALATVEKLYVITDHWILFTLFSILRKFRVQSLLVHLQEITTLLHFPKKLLKSS